MLMTAVRPAETPDGIGTLPLDLLLVAISAQAGRELSSRLGGWGAGTDSA